MRTSLASAIAILCGLPLAHAASLPGRLLEDMTWKQAATLLNSKTVVVIPLGAEAKEHGPHLKLKNDFLLAEYFKRRVLERTSVVVAPTVNYHFYPAFEEYPGSTSLRLETARDLMVDICRSLARFGPRKFYVLNTGVSTVRALAPAAELLASEGIVLRYTDLKTALGPIEAKVARQPGGTHADEIETSMMLFIAPKTVDMSKAVKDFHPDGKVSGMSPDPKTQKTYSPTGSWGDPTLATRKKGELVVNAFVETLVREIEELRAKSP